MAITTMDGLLTAYATAKRYPFYIPSVGTEGAGTYSTQWIRAARQPLTGAAPGTTARACSSSTAGALNPNMGSATSGKKFYLAGVSLVSTALQTILLYDRLVDVSGYNGTEVNVDTAVNNTAITRPDANGAGVELWQDIYAGYGSTASTLNIKYTDQSGNTAQVATYSHPANQPSDGQAAPITLASGDTGVRAVTNYHWSISTGSNGNIGFTLRRRIGCVFPIQTIHVPIFFTPAQMGLVEVPDDACLEMMVMCAGSSTGIFMGEIVIVEG